MEISSTTARRMMGLLRVVNSKQDLIIINQELIMAKQAEADKAMTALETKEDERGVALQEQLAAIQHEIEQLKAAGTGGTGDGMSAEEVDAMIVRLEAVATKVETGTGTVRSSTESMKADD